MALYQIVYRSKATAPFAEDDLVALLEKARSHNAGKNISGLLLYGYNQFFQLLEGDDELVKDLFFNRINNDSRHGAVKVLQEGYTAKRLFGQWAMAFRPLDAKRAKLLEGFVDPDVQSEYGRNLLAPLKMTDALEMLSMEVESRNSKHPQEQNED
jgi:Sensors of blue-light using FAD